MRAYLRDLTPGQEYALRFRSNTGEEVSEWSQIQRFITTDDLTAPAQPTNLSWADSGAAFIATWDKVTTDATGAPMRDFRFYRVNVDNGATDVDFFTTGEHFELTRSANEAQFGNLETELTISVYAVDMTYNESVPAVAVSSPGDPPIPSTPTLSGYFGSLLVEWDGKANDNTAMPNNVTHVEVYAGTSATFTASNSTLRDRIVINRNSSVQRALLTGLTNGTTYYVRLIAVNAVDKRSPQSASSNGVTKTNLTGIQIEDGSINTSQINFTARELGGANAYYGTAFPTGGTYKDGDIFYNTAVPPAANAGKTYRHNGTTWVEDATIGVISGLKILTNTLTADAVGTNEIIANKANIAEGLIDSAHIDFLNANVITTGVLQSSFNVVYGGVTQPAWSIDVNGNLTLNNVTVNGQLTVGASGNTSALNTAITMKSYNYVAGVSGWAIKGDGSVEFGSGLMRGSFKTAETGRRVEIISGGNQGTIDFWSPANDHGWIRTLTEANAGALESIQMGLGDPDTAWARGVVNLNDTNYLVMRGSTFETFYHTEYRMFLTDNVGSLAGVYHQRVGISKDGMTMWDQAGTPRMYFNSSGVWLDAASSQVYFRFQTDGQVWFNRGAAENYIEAAIDGSFRISAGTSRGSVFFLSSSNTQIGFKQQFLTYDNFGCVLRLVYNTSNARLEVRDVNDTGYEDIFASAFTVNSDMRVKEDIMDIPQFESLQKVRGIIPKHFKRKGVIPVALVEEGQPIPEPTAEGSPVEIGFVAQELPEELVKIGGDDGNESLGVDLGQTLALLYAAFHDRESELETRFGKIEAQLTTILAALPQIGKR